MGIVPAIVFVRDGCPYCSKVLDELERSGLDYQVLDFDAQSSINYMIRVNMLVREPPLLQTPDNFYVLTDFFDKCDLDRFDHKLLHRIMQGLTFIWN